MKVRRTFWRVLLFLFAVFILLLWKSGFLNHLQAERSEESLVSDRNSKKNGIQVAKEVKMFVFNEDFHFPQPQVMKPLEEIRDLPWMHSLHAYLQSLGNNMQQVNLLTSNFKYVDVLLNWLISAVVRSGIPIKSILVLSMDSATHGIMERKGFCSILITPSTLFSPRIKFSSPFEGVMMLRLTLMRIINHFGFDVAIYDTDAIMLRDPQEVFDSMSDADIIGSVGTIPQDLFKEWRVTICIGVVMVKSTFRTGEEVSFPPKNAIHYKIVCMVV